MADTNLLDPFDMRGRVALVTGGTTGIGRACVERLHRYGAAVAFTFADGLEDEKAVRERFEDPAMTVHPLELRSATSIRACLSEVVARHGRIDVLVNNAAVGSATVACWSDAVNDHDGALFAINAEGTLKITQGFLDLDSDRQRKIITIASVGGGVAAFPGFRLADGMSKAAVAHMTRQLAAETVHDPIDVFAVCPGATDTAMFRASTLEPLDEADRTRFLSRLPNGRLIRPEEVAGLVHFLATDSSSLLHGAVIDASMGLGVRPGLLTEETDAHGTDGR